MPSKGKLIVCIKCHRTAKLCARSLCNTCYDADIQSRKVRECKNCGEMRPHHSKGLCGECYRQQYNKSTWQRFLEYLRNDRIKRPDVHHERDRKRDATEKRQQWRHQYAQRDDVREKNVQHVSEYKKNHKDKSDIWGHSRRARIRGLPHDMTVDEWNRIVENHNHCCHYCGKPCDNLQKEHRVPVSRGGGFTKDNIVPACPNCNYRKNDMTDSEFFEYVRKYPS